MKFLLKLKTKAGREIYVNAQQVNYIADAENGTIINCSGTEQRLTESAFDVATLVDEALQIKGQLSSKTAGSLQFAASPG